MEQIGSLSHTKWECKYHVVWILKCRRKVLYGDLRKYLGDVLKKLELFRPDPYGAVSLFKPKAKRHHLEYKME
jgi:hypothetical protein